MSTLFGIDILLEFEVNFISALLVNLLPSSFYQSLIIIKCGSSGKIFMKK